MMELCLGEIEKACGGKIVWRQGRTGENADTRVDSVALDSRKVTAQGVFVATEGERVDGHRFVGQVFEKGVCLAIVQKTPEQVEASEGVPAESWGNYLLVPDTLQALKDLAEYYRTKLSIPIVGITGSVGKTSTKEFVATVLSEKYRVLKTEGNYNNEIGVPLTILRIRPEHEAAVIEMGISDFGEMHRLSKIVRPNVCVITNIGQCHLENLKDRDGVLKAKTEIFDYMAEDGYVCLNGGDDKLRSVGEVKGKAPYFFGRERGSAEVVYASDIVSKGLWGSDAVLHMAAGMLQGEYAESSFSVHVPLPGEHMVGNSAAAACVAGLLGLTGEQIQKGIGRVEATEGRNHLIRLPHYTLIDDCYNANPVSMKAALDLLAMADTVKVAVLGDMFELGENSALMHAEVGNYAVQKKIDCIICVGENSRFLSEGAFLEAERQRSEGMSAVGEGEDGPRIFYFADRQSLLQELAKDRERMIPEGCTVLVKASHGMAFAEVSEYLQKAISLP